MSSLSLLTDDENIIKAIGCILRQLCERSDVSADDPETFKSFVALQLPTISILDYAKRLQRYMCCSPACFVIAMVYIDRLIQRNSRIIIHPLTIHRLLFVAVVCACKFWDDEFYKNSFYARVGGVTVKELNRLELDILLELDFQLHVDIGGYEQYRQELTKHVEQNRCQLCAPVSSANSAPTTPQAKKSFNYTSPNYASGSSTPVAKKREVSPALSQTTLNPTAKAFVPTAISFPDLQRFPSQETTFPNYPPTNPSQDQSAQLQMQMQTYHGMQQSSQSQLGIEIPNGADQCDAMGNVECMAVQFPQTNCVSPVKTIATGYSFYGDYTEDSTTPSKGKRKQDVVGWQDIRPEIKREKPSPATPMLSEVQASPTDGPLNVIEQFLSSPLFTGNNYPNNYTENSSDKSPEDGWDIIPSPRRKSINSPTTLPEWDVAGRMAAIVMSNPEQLTQNWVY